MMTIQFSVVVGAVVTVLVSAGPVIAKAVDLLTRVTEVLAL